MQTEITGTTASDISESVRALIERGDLGPGAALPSVRSLAEKLGVNRNTAVAAYGQLTQAGLVETRGRGGTRVADRARVAQEGFAQERMAPGSALRDVGTGNPDPTLIPDPSAALARMGGRPVLYGEPVIDRDLEVWAHAWMSDVPTAERRITITSGAADAVDRLLAQALTRDDAVALEDPCFLTSIHTVRLGGYRAVPVPVDAEGMTVAGLRSAIDQGVRAIVCTPRAQNPTGASLSERRARDLRKVLAAHPYVLVIEDDHFSMLSQRPYHSLVGPAQRRWAVIRSVSKFLGPDMGVAVTASDPDTADRLAMRLTPGTTWVSHLLQRLVHALVTDDKVMDAVAAAGVHYAERNARFAGQLTERGLGVEPGDGLSLWLPLPAPARAVAEQLMRRGWLARSGEDFVIADLEASRRLRLTVHDLDDSDAGRLVDDVVAAVAAARSQASMREVG